jgi:glycosyltransferase 2 family protein
MKTTYQKEFSRKKLVKNIVFAILGGLILFLVFRKTDVNALWEDIALTKKEWIIAALIVGAWGHWIRASRWTIMLKSMDYNVKTYPGFLTVLSGYLINLAIPRAGEVSRCALMSQVTGVPANTLIGTVVTERIIDLVMTIIIVFSVLSLQYQLLSDFTYQFFLLPFLDKWNHWNPEPFALILMFAISIAVIVLLVMLGRKKQKSSKNNTSDEVNHEVIDVKPSRWMSLIEGFLKGIKSVLQLKQPLLFICYTFAIWGTYLMSTYCITQAFEFTAEGGLLLSLSVLLFSTIGVILPAPGGVGSIYTTGLGLQEIYGYSEPKATVFASVLFFTQVIGFVTLGTFSLIHLSLMKNKAKQHGGI